MATPFTKKDKLYLISIYVLSFIFGSSAVYVLYTLGGWRLPYGIFSLMFSIAFMSVIRRTWKQRVEAAKTTTDLINELFDLLGKQKSSAK